MWIVQCVSFCRVRIIIAVLRPPPPPRTTIATNRWGRGRRVSWPVKYVAKCLKLFPIWRNIKLCTVMNRKTGESVLLFWIIFVNNCSGLQQFKPTILSDKDCLLISLWVLIAFGTAISRIFDRKLSKRSWFCFRF